MNREGKKVWWAVVLTLVPLWGKMDKELEEPEKKLKNTPRNFAKILLNRTDIRAFLQDLYQSFKEVGGDFYPLQIADDKTHPDLGYAIAIWMKLEQQSYAVVSVRVEVAQKRILFFFDPRPLICDEHWTAQEPIEVHQIPIRCELEADAKQLRAEFKAIKKRLMALYVPPRKLCITWDDRMRDARNQQVQERLKRNPRPGR